MLGFADTVSSRDASHLVATGSTISMGVYSAAWGRRQLEPLVTTPVIGPIHAMLERRWYIFVYNMYDIIVKKRVQPNVIPISQITNPKSIITNMYVSENGKKDRNLILIDNLTI
jgi:hypothetical protein